MHLGEGWGGVLAEGERPERVASFACLRPWGREGGLLAAVYECVGERNRENAGLITDQLLPEIVADGISEDGDPRRNLRAAWNRFAENIGTPKKNHVSFLLVHVTADRLLCARVGGGQAHFVNWRNSHPMACYVDGRLHAHRVSNEVMLPLLLLGTPGVWERLGFDHHYERQVFRAFGEQGIPEAIACLQDRLKVRARTKGTYAGVLIDLTSFHQPSPGS